MRHHNYTTSHLTPCLLYNYPYGLVSAKWGRIYPMLTAIMTSHYLNILVLVPEMLCDELHSLGGLVRLGGQEDVAASK